MYNLSVCLFTVISTGMNLRRVSPNYCCGYNSIRPEQLEVYYDKGQQLVYNEHN